MIRLQSSTSFKRKDWIKSLAGWFYYNLYIPYLFKIFKYALSIWTGKSEIERIVQNKAGEALLVQLVKSLCNSTKVHSVYTSLISQDKFDVEKSCDFIVTMKNIRSSSIISKLRGALAEISEINTLYRQIETIRKTGFNKESKEHQELLEHLWYVAMQRDRNSPEEWEDIGFQGKDPASDFRGMGLLGLSNLHYMACKYPKLLRWIHAHCPYPFAITGINMTGILGVYPILIQDVLTVYFEVKMLSSGELTQHLLKNGSTLTQFQDLYCYVMLMFGRFSDKPENISLITFPSVMSSFLELLNGNIDKWRGEIQVPDLTSELENL